MSAISSASRFHRIIKRLRRFRPATEEIASAYKTLVAREDVVLGIYRGDSPETDLVFTDSHLIFIDALNGCMRKVGYRDIVSVDFPLPASDFVILCLGMFDGTTAKVQVVGRDGKYRDVFEVGRFLMRVAEDRQSDPGAPGL